MALISGGVLIGLLVAEGLVRWIRAGENLHVTATLGVFAPDRELGWVHKRNFTGGRNWLGRRISIRTDAHGYRIPDGQIIKPEPAQVAFAGDSYVFGYEVDAEETFVHLLGKQSGKRTVIWGLADIS